MSSDSTIPTFHPFPLLPPELRSQIYILAHPPPRTVTLSLPNYQCKPSYIPPPLSLTSGFAHLLVSREARDVLLREYKRVFVGYPFPAKKDITSERGRGEGRGRGWYFNYEKDTLGMMSGVRGLRYFLRRFPEDMRGVRWLDFRPTAHCDQALEWSLDEHRGVEQTAVESGGHTHTGLEVGMEMEMEMRLSDLTDLKLITIRILPRPTRSLYEFQSWCYSPYYRKCVKSIVALLNDRRKSNERRGGRDVEVAVCHELVSYDDTDSFAGMKTKALSVEVEERLRVMRVLGPGCGVQRIGVEVDFDVLR